MCPGILREHPDPPTRFTAKGESCSQGFVGRYTCRSGLRFPDLQAVSGIEIRAGNPIVSPLDTSGTNPNEARLRYADTNPVSEEHPDIHAVRHLGANGRWEPADTGFDSDVTFTFDDYHAALTAQVEVLFDEGNTIPSDSIIVVCVFSPHAENPALIQVFKNFATLEDDASPDDGMNLVRCEIPLDSGLTMGLRVVRAYLFTGAFEDFTPAGSLAKSRVKLVTLRPGDNFLQLTIDK
ncbi:MAG: hypothetical protein EOP84_08910 [Verrucomicrobiaceae bacterium]|nr:MAG: hypothetical protein EOP84_08910 [Verrucomicrobiaceae bacterium]